MSDSDLPQGWSWIPLGELIQPVMTRDLTQEPNIEITYFDIGSIDNELGVVTNPKRVLSSKAPSRARQVVEAGDVLFSTVRPYLRGIAQVPPTENGMASTGFCVLRPENSISAKYLYYFVRSDAFLDGLLPLQRGASYPAVRAVDVLTQLIPVAPSAEQNRIVEKLDELLSGIETSVNELNAAQKKLENYRQSLLKATVDGAFTAEWRAERAQRGKEAESGAQLLARILTERRVHWEAMQLAKFKEQGKIPPKNWQDKYPEPVQSDTTDLPALPDGWLWATIDQLSLEQKYGSSSKTGSDSSGVPVIRMGNIQNGELDLQNLKYLPVDHEEFPTLLLADGDLLFNRTNSSELVGKTAVFRSQVVPCSYASYLIAVRFSPWFVPELAAAYINSVFGRRWINSVVTQQTGQANVNGTKLSTLAIPLPPAEEQAEIMRLLQEQRKSFFDQSFNIELSLKRSAAQRKNILQAAFSGQLVQQDPNDESARELLVHIRAEREVRERQPKPRKIKIKKGILAMITKLKDVLAEAGDWIPAQEAFRRCGVADSAHTDQVEALYAELRELDKSNQLAVESVKDTQGRKLYDQLKFIVTT
ncbi:MAG: restriction endonuclease subunit S [Gallionella sp.]|jgi:type I restriction enzyme S subunit